ncbi:hypothetical protein [Parabacteroides sp. AM08-6]|uniref:TapB family protein n=1 Tax=Parabacteroides sp. AM08-6 TaxID=2292053 RepID=UPI000EFE1C60|nr:hypothetical protein [Parabacteroides sp. AM08-6]RHJ84816.1 hypothetical protein DW103_05050 [Parabacteroides sp. AM08-6]
MKSKVLLASLALLFTAGAMAQDCTFFFPQTQGAQLVKKGYDGKGNLIGVMTYTVDEVGNTPTGIEVEADYIFTNKAGTVIDKGDLDAYCQNGEFFMDMKEVLSNPSFVSDMQSDIAVVDDVINYPSVANSPSGDGQGMYFDDALIRIYSKKNKKDRKNISIYDREYVTTEQVQTPAGTFDCTKVKYKIKSRSPKETIEGYGYEWYAPNIGVVRNEQYNNNNQLQYYTVLEEVK